MFSSDNLLFLLFIKRVSFKEKIIIPLSVEMYFLDPFIIIFLILSEGSLVFLELNILKLPSFNNTNPLVVDIHLLLKLSTVILSILFEGISEFFVLYVFHL